MKRLSNWPALLAAFFASRQSLAFGWSSNDCVLFAADAALAILGVDLLADLRGTWRDEASALAALAAVGGVAHAPSKLLPRLASPRFAQRGDLVLVHTAEPLEGLRRHYAVCDADRWAAPHRSGIVRGPMRTAVRAWGVGHG